MHPVPETEVGTEQRSKHIDNASMLSPGVDPSLLCPPLCLDHRKDASPSVFIFYSFMPLAQQRTFPIETAPGSRLCTGCNRFQGRTTKLAGKQEHCRESCIRVVGVCQTWPHMSNRHMGHVSHANEADHYHCEHGSNTQKAKQSNKSNTHTGTLQTFQHHASSQNAEPQLAAPSTLTCIKRKPV